MKKRKFPLDKVLKYRSYLEKDQASRFREAMDREKTIDSMLTSQHHLLKNHLKKRDKLVTGNKLNINQIKGLQEEILFAELDETVLQSELFRATDQREQERAEWLRKKSDADAVEKLKDKFKDVLNKENLDEEQKEIDEIARQNYLKENKKQ